MSGTKVADTDRGKLIVTLQAPLPLHAPDQPVNMLPGLGVAVNDTVVVWTKEYEHVESQLATGDEGEEIAIDPLPVPSFDTDNVSNGVNRADTDRLLFMFTVQELALAVSHPDQPLNTLPESGEAVNVN